MSYRRSFSIVIQDGDNDKSMFMALTSIYKNRFEDALRFIDEARSLLITFFPSLLEGSDTYSRSYEMMVKFQVRSSDIVSPRHAATAAV